MFRHKMEEREDYFGPRAIASFFCCPAEDVSEQNRSTATSEV